jgi:hypothetical protein
MPEELSVTMRGVCNLRFERGIEGIYWAFQDERFVEIPDPTTLCCAKCGRVWDTKRDERPPKRIFDDECDHHKDHQWKLLYPNGLWLHAGLHMLHDGDLLTLFDKEDPSKILWKERILLNPAPVAGVHLRARAYCIQCGVPEKKWEQWFTKNYPAELTLGPASFLHWEKWRREGIEAKLKELGRA